MGFHIVSGHVYTKTPIHTPKHTHTPTNTHTHTHPHTLNTCAVLLYSMCYTQDPCWFTHGHTNPCSKSHMWRSLKHTHTITNLHFTVSNPQNNEHTHTNNECNTRFRASAIEIIPLNPQTGPTRISLQMQIQYFLHSEAAADKSWKLFPPSLLLFYLCCWYSITWVCTISPSLLQTESSLNNEAYTHSHSHTHTHTDTHIYISIYIYP